VAAVGFERLLGFTVDWRDGSEEQKTPKIPNGIVGGKKRIPRDLNLGTETGISAGD
jgi:hypothetical protein